MTQVLTWTWSDGQVCPVTLHAPIGDFRHGAVVGQRGVTAESGHGTLNSLKSARTALFQAVVPEELAGGVFRLGHAVSHNDNPITGL
jgi:hypothetical protein